MLLAAAALLALLPLAQDGAPGAEPPAAPVPAPDAWTTVGARVPALELPLIDGSGTFDLASLRGKRALLIQFASW